MQGQTKDVRFLEPSDFGLNYLELKSPLLPGRPSVLHGWHGVWGSFVVFRALAPGCVPVAPTARTNESRPSPSLETQAPASSVLATSQSLYFSGLIVLWLYDHLLECNL